MSLRWKIILLVSLALLGAMGLSAWVMTMRERTMVRRELEHNSRVITTALMSGAAGDILHENLGNIDVMRRRIESDTPGIEHLYIWNRDGDPLTRNTPSRKTAPLHVRYVLETGRATRRSAHSGRVPVLEIFTPLRIGGHTYAVVCTGFSLEPLRQRQRQIQRVDAAIFGSLIIVFMLAAALLSGYLTRPLQQLTELSGRVAKGELDHSARVTTRDEIGKLARAFNEMIDGLRERQFIKDTFSRYVTTQVAEELLSDPGRVALGGARQEVTVLFSDIRGFTAMSERLSPEDVVTQLNEYLSAMIDVIFKYEGTLDKFVGDAIMAVFGAPIPHDDDPLRAVQTALEMQQRLLELNRKWEREGRSPLTVGMGINTGDAIAGNIGDMRRMEYTVIGFAVNLASRLESLTAKYGLCIVISEATYEYVKDHVTVRKLDPVDIKGSTVPVRVFEVTGWKPRD